MAKSESFLVERERARARERKGGKEEEREELTRQNGKEERREITTTTMHHAWKESLKFLCFASGFLFFPSVCEWQREE